MAFALYLQYLQSPAPVPVAGLLTRSNTHLNAQLNATIKGYAAAISSFIKSLCDIPLFMHFHVILFFFLPGVGMELRVCTWRHCRQKSMRVRPMRGGKTLSGSVSGQFVCYQTHKIHLRWKRAVVRLTALIDLTKKVWNFFSTDCWKLQKKGSKWIAAIHRNNWANMELR